MLVKYHVIDNHCVSWRKLVYYDPALQCYIIHITYFFFSETFLCVFVTTSETAISEGLKFTKLKKIIIKSSTSSLRRDFPYIAHQRVKTPSIIHS